MPTPKDTLNTLAPGEFSVVSDAIWDLVAPWAKQAVSQAQYGDNYDFALALWTGHILTVLGVTGGDSGATGGALVKSMSVGEVKVAYDTATAAGGVSGEDEFLGQTRWGRILAGLSVQYRTLHLFLT